MNLSAHILKIAKAAKAASYALALVPAHKKNTALKAMARALLENQDYLIKANARDLKAVQVVGYSIALIDRLTLNSQRIKAMADSLLETAKLKDPVGKIL